VKPLYDLAAGQILFRARLMGGELTEQALEANGAALLGARRPAEHKAAE
jgi:hypothetical protein